MKLIVGAPSVLREAFDLVRQVLALGPTRRCLDSVLLLPFGPCHRAFGRLDDHIFKRVRHRRRLRDVIIRAYNFLPDWP